MPIAFVLGVVALSLRLAPEPSVRDILDTALARMGGMAALRAVDRVQLQVMTEWQRTEFDTSRQPTILSYELATELRDYSKPAWRYARRFFSPNGTSEVIDLVVDSVAAIGMNGRWQPQNIAYVDERDEVFIFTPERVVRLARESADSRRLADTVIAGERYVRVAATIGRFQPTLYFRRGDGLLARARMRAGQPNDFGLAPWGVMEVEIRYSRWQKVAGSALVLPMQLDVIRAGRPYKRMTTIAMRVNPMIPADSLTMADSLRAAFLVSARKPMFDLPLDSARIVDGAFALFGAPGTPPGAVKVGGRWLLLEGGTAPLSVERSVMFLRHSDRGPIAGVLITAPSGSGGVAWLTHQPLNSWITPPAMPFAETSLRGWPVGPTHLRRLPSDGWLRVGSDSVRIESVDLPDYPAATVVYVPALRWAYAWAAGPVQLESVVAHARRRGWRVDRIGSVRNFIGAPVLAESAVAR